MYKFILSFLLLVPIAQPAICQPGTEITGRVLTREGNPVPGASIHLLNTDWTVQADAKGYFKLSGIGKEKQVLLISSVGFAAQTVEATAGDTLEIILETAARKLDEVLVTAQKKAESLQRVPLSITSLNERQVRDYRLWTTNEITGISPNLYSSNSGDDRNVTSIRGITTTSYDPAIATYIDGVNQFGLDTYIANLLDVERIEILRGPQGSLYGRNALGGVINIITKTPGNQPAGFAEMSLGNYGQQRLAYGLSAPLVKNKLFAGVSALYQKRDGYYYNSYTAKKYDRQKTNTASVFLKYLPGNNWDITLNAKFNINRNEGAFPLVFGLADALDNPFTLLQNATAKMIDNTVNSSLSIQHTGSRINFSSQSAFQTNHRYYDAPLDGDFSPIDGITIINDFGKAWNKVKVFTQEFKITSPAAALARLKWTAGLYFYFQDNPVKQTTHFGEDAALLGSPDKNFSLINTNKGRNTGAALYGQLNIALTEKWKLTAGIRGDYESRKFNIRGEYQADGGMPVTLQPDTSAATDYRAFSPSVSTAYQLNQQTLFFAGYSRGFRTGGITQLGTDPSQPPLYSFKPEYSNNFEAGIKNSFYKNRLRFNVTFFLTHVADVQVPTLILPDAITITRNAGKLESKGVELELATIPLKHLQVEYNFGYTDASFTRLKIPQNGAAVDLAGKKQVFTPASTSMLAMQYHLPLKGKWGLNFRGEWLHLGKQYFDLANSMAQGAYSLLNGKAGICFGQTELWIWSRNLGNYKYVSYAYDFGAVHLGNPETWGITLSSRF